MHTRDVFNPENHPPLAPTYSHISVFQISDTAKLVSVAGQTGATIADASKYSFQQQMRNALANVDRCLAAAGAEKKDITAVRQYVVKLTELDTDDAKARPQIYSEWWKQTEKDRPFPPSTLIGVHSLVGKDLVYEIEVSAVVRR